MTVTDSSSEHLGAQSKNRTRGSHAQKTCPGSLQIVCRVNNTRDLCRGIVENVCAIHMQDPISDSTRASVRLWTVLYKRMRVYDVLQYFLSMLSRNVTRCPSVVQAMRYFEQFSCESGQRPCPRCFSLPTVYVEPPLPVYVCNASST